MKNSDIFIMIPIECLNIQKTNTMNYKGDGDCDEFYKSLDKQINYACKDIVKDAISIKNSLGKFKLKYYTDDNYERGKNNYKWIDCYAYLRIQETTKLGILEIIIKHLEYEDSLVGGTILGDHAVFKSSHISNGKELTLDKVITELGLRIVGNYRILYQNKFVKDNSKLKYLLSGETKVREKDVFNIESDFFTKNFKDLVDYDEFELFASDKAIVSLSKVFKNSFVANIDSEIMPFYIIEFSILQNSAINRMNLEITNALKSDGKLTLKTSLKMIEEFGKTIVLWDKNIYKYYFDQKAADGLYLAFKTDKLWDEYKKNKSHLDQLTSIKNSISSKRESFILGALSFLFTLINLYELIINFKEKSMTPNSLAFSFTIIYLIWVVYLLHKSRT